MFDNWSAWELLVVGPNLMIAKQSNLIVIIYFQYFLFVIVSAT